MVILCPTLRIGVQDFMHNTGWYSPTLEFPKPASIDPPCVLTIHCISIRTVKHKKSAAVIEKVALLEHSELGFSVCGTDNVNTNGRHKCIPVCQIVWFTATSKKVRQSNVEDSTIKAYARKLLVKTNTLAIFLLLHGCLVFSTENKILDPLHSEAAVALTLTCVANSPLVTLLLTWFCYLRCLT